MNNKYRRLIRDIAIFALGALGSKLIAFFLLPLYTHVLTAEEYGISDLIFSLGQLLLPVISLAIFNGLLRYGLMPDVRPENTLYCATKVFFIGSLMMILATPFLKVIPSIGIWRWYLCVYVVSSFAFTNSFVYLKVKDKNRLYAALSILQTLVLVVCNIVLLVGFGLGIQGYLLSYIISNTIAVASALVLGGILSDFRIGKYDPALMKSMILFSLPYILNDISWWAIHSSNKLIIEFLMGSAVLGIYTTASKIPSLINVFTSIFTQAWGLSSIKEYDSSNDTKFYTEVFNIFIVVISGVCIAAVSAVKIFMKFYVSADFFESWQYIPLLMIGAVFLSISGFFGSMLGAMKKTGNLMWTSLMAGIVNIMCNLILIPEIGLWGASVSTVITYLTVSLFRLYSVRKHMKNDYKIKKTFTLLMVMMIHAILVGFDFYIIEISAVTVLVYLLIVRNDMKNFLKYLRINYRK